MNHPVIAPATLLALLAGSAISQIARAQSTDPFPAAFELSSLLPANGGDGTHGFVLNGIDAFDLSGASASSAGDVNGDGVNDIIIGASSADPNGKSAGGESYVVFGRHVTVCQPDLNGDGIVDQGDIQAFIALFLVQDLAVDFNSDGIIDQGDIQTFIAAFLAGC